MRLHLRYFFVIISVTIVVALVGLYHWIFLKHDFFEKRSICYVPLMQTRANSLSSMLELLYNSFPDEK